MVQEIQQMLFNSFFFILIFFPLMLAGWYLLNHFHYYKAAQLYLTAMSFWFYGLFSWKFLFILTGSILVSYFLSFLLNKFPHSALFGKSILLISIMFHLGVLFLCKYYGFFIENINVAFHDDLPLRNIIMPIGISFYTFQQLSFLIDRYRKEAPHYSLLDYTSYVAFFPKLIEGPIAFHEEIISQFHNEALRHFNSERFTRGLILFVIGLGKKVLLADTLALPVNYGFEQTYYLDTVTVILVMLAYTFEIYFDFSGYCDMASGISLMLGITLPANFKSPYKSATVKELWQRWHITLSRFFIKYVYIPLGGSRHGKLRTVLNVLVVFILSGLWHGAGWTYICWGLMQGLLVVWDDLGIVGVRESDGSLRLHRYLLRKKPLFTVSRKTGQFFTFTFFVISLIFVRSESMAYAGAMFRRLFTFTWPGFLYRVAGKLDVAEIYVIKEAVSLLAPGMLNLLYVIIFIILIAISAFIITRKNALEISSETLFSKKLCSFLIIVFVWSFLSLSQVSTFIYFKF